RVLRLELRGLAVDRIQHDALRLVWCIEWPVVDAAAIEPDQTVRCLDVVRRREVAEGATILPLPRRIPEQTAGGQARAVSGVGASNGLDRTQVANRCGRSKALLLPVRRVVVLCPFGRFENGAVAEGVVPLPFLDVGQRPLNTGRGQVIEVGVGSASSP